MASQMTQGSTQSTQGTQEGGVAGQRPYMIGGITVMFPTKAYPSQLAMMNKVIQGLKQKKNCLLESPTGSGKTLALLCATLAWQRHEANRVKEYNAAIDARQEAIIQEQKQKRKSVQPEHQNPETSCGETSSTSFESKDSIVSPRKNEGQAGGDVSTYFSTPPVMELTDDEDDFKPTKRTKSLTPNEMKSSEQNLVVPNVQKTEKLNATITETKPAEQSCALSEKKLIVPKIYFGTRTHKQIAQVTRELRKTFYKPVRSVVLASREHTCINPLVENLPNKNEHCRELLDNTSQIAEGCSYHLGAKKFGSFSGLQNYGVQPGYDLEDLVKAGREAKSCPYYATRFLMNQADIIFCPYNYIVDPSIRRSMGIELTSHIVIFDEAHNMEDAAREAASFSMRQADITKAMQDCEKVRNIGGVEPYALGETAKLLSAVSIWIDEQGKNFKEISFNSTGKCWTGTESIASFEASDLNQENIKMYEAYFKSILAQRDRDMELMKERGVRFQFEKPTITTATILTVENVFRMFEELFKNNGRSRDDFRIAIIKQSEKRRRDGTTGPFITAMACTINVWCLNPAVSFAHIRDEVHAIVLTSGTLSPMQSFESELGTLFPLRLEASHVIDRNQVWAGLIGVGPKGVNLNGSYQNTESFAYQDEIGNVIQFVCDTMPYGVLCFFPSYRMMDKMLERWKMTDRYSQINAKKHMVVEPRTGAADFEAAINEFYNAVKNCDGENAMHGNTGAIFLAVCRGKVSEGLDFSDNNARAVICIGIPFPNFRDMQVELKRNYNQKNMSRGLLSGGDWYEIQAFRALNQALGRCIRHRMDWGAILLIDDRYIRTPRYIGSLSKWIRSSVMTFENFRNLPASLQNFSREMKARPVHQDTFSQVSKPQIPNYEDNGATDKFLSAIEEERGIDILEFGMNIRGIEDGEQREPLVSFANTFSVCIPDSNACDNTGNVADVLSPAQLNVSTGSESEFNPNPNSKVKGAIVFTGPKLPSTSTNIIRGPKNNLYAMFARQQSQPSQASQSAGPSGVSPTRMKRPRERKIKL